MAYGSRTPEGHVRHLLNACGTVNLLDLLRVPRGLSLCLDTPTPMTLAALSDTLIPSSGEGAGIAASFMSMDGRLDACLDADAPCLRDDFVLVGAGGPPRMKLEKVVVRSSLIPRRLSLSEPDDFSAS
jgi:hypothetical protein